MREQPAGLIGTRASSRSRGGFGVRAEVGTGGLRGGLGVRVGVVWAWNEVAGASRGRAWAWPGVRTQAG